MDHCKVEVLSICDNGVLEKSNWTEYYSKKYIHPYNTHPQMLIKDSWIRACGTDNFSEEMTYGTPSIGEFGHWLNDDLSFLADRVTGRVGVDGELGLCFSDNISEAMECGKPRVFTLVDNPQNFAVISVTPIEKLPSLVIKYFDQRKQEDGQLKNLNYTDLAYAMLTNAVREANGEPPLPLPLKEFKIDVSYTEHCYVKVNATDMYDAIRKAQQLGPSEGVWFQADPDYESCSEYEYKVC